MTSKFITQSFIVALAASTILSSNLSASAQGAMKKLGITANKDTSLYLVKNPDKLAEYQTVKNQVDADDYVAGVKAGKDLPTIVHEAVGGGGAQDPAEVTAVAHYTHLYGAAPDPHIQLSHDRLQAIKALQKGALGEAGVPAPTQEQIDALIKLGTEVSNLVNGVGVAPVHFPLHADQATWVILKGYTGAAGHEYCIAQVLDEVPGVVANPGAVPPVAGVPASVEFKILLNSSGPGHELHGLQANPARLVNNKFKIEKALVPNGFVKDKFIVFNDLEDVVEPTFVKFKNDHKVPDFVVGP